MSIRQADELRGLHNQLDQLGRGTGPAVERVVNAIGPRLRTVLGYAELASEYLPQLRQFLKQTAETAPQVKAMIPDGLPPLPGRTGRTRFLAAGALLGAGALLYVGMRSRAAARRTE